MLSVMDSVFQALIVVIVVAGSAHTIASFYREKQERRRWRAGLKRLRLGDSNAWIMRNRIVSSLAKSTWRLRNNPCQRRPTISRLIGRRVVKANLLARDLRERSLMLNRFNPFVETIFSG
jgi:hypothetical protein